MQPALEFYVGWMESPQGFILGPPFIPLIPRRFGDILKFSFFFFDPQKAQKRPKRAVLGQAPLALRPMRVDRGSQGILRSPVICCD